MYYCTVKSTPVWLKNIEFIRDLLEKGCVGIGKYGE
jgi:hypothetical protein